MDACIIIEVKSGCVTIESAKGYPIIIIKNWDENQMHIYRGTQEITEYCTRRISKVAPKLIDDMTVAHGKE